MTLYRFPPRQPPQTKSHVEMSATFQILVLISAHCQDAVTSEQLSPSSVAPLLAAVTQRRPLCDFFQISAIIPTLPLTLMECDH